MSSIFKGELFDACLKFLAGGLYRQESYHMIVDIIDHYHDEADGIEHVVADLKSTNFLTESEVVNIVINATRILNDRRALVSV